MQTWLNASSLVISNSMIPLRGQHDSFMIVGMDVFLFVGDNVVAIVPCKEFLNIGAKA